jgi:hypothetical protein
MAKRGYPFECRLCGSWPTALIKAAWLEHGLKAYDAFPSRSSASDPISSNRPHATSSFDRMGQRGYPPN